MDSTYNSVDQSVYMSAVAEMDAFFQVKPQETEPINIEFIEKIIEEMLSGINYENKVDYLSNEEMGNNEEEITSLLLEIELENISNQSEEKFEKLSNGNSLSSSGERIDILYNSNGSSQNLQASDFRQSEAKSISEYFKDSNDVKVYVKKASIVSEGWLGMQSYYVYNIESKWKSEQFQVTRRFRDLEWLNRILRERYKGMPIPPLPEKSILNNSNKKFLEHRRIEIEMYLTILGKHPILKSSLPFKLFLQCPEETFPTEQHNLDASSNKFQYTDIEDAFDQIISIVEAKLNFILIRKIEPFSKELAAVDKAISTLYEPTHNFYLAFSSLVEAQNNVQANLENMSFPEIAKFERIIGEVSISIQSPNEELNNLAMNLKEEALKTEALKNAIFDYKKTMKKYSEFELLINRKLNKQRYSSDPSKCEKYIKEIEFVQNEIENIEKELEMIEENIKKESIWFHAEREESFERILEKITQFQKDRWLIESRIWQEKIIEG